MPDLVEQLAFGASVPIRRRLLITGHPRAGTGYMAALAKVMGLDVAHEYMGEDGISSCWMAPPVWRVCFHRGWGHRGRLWYEFDRVVEVVREPLAHLASVAFTENAGGDTPEQREDRRTSLWWRAAWVPLDLQETADPIAQAVQSIVGWHAMIRQWLPDAKTIRLEEARYRLPEVVGGPVQPERLDPGVVNARPHADLTWQGVRERCADPLWRALMEYCDELGYQKP